MKFTSTRSESISLTFTEAVLQGLCQDGGLALPEEVPELSKDQLKALSKESYCELALSIMSLFATDIPKADLQAIIQRAYTKEKFGSDEIVSLTKLNDDYILGLSNGPTYAFKDMAMQFLGEILPYLLNKTGQKLNIVGATSGDTGSSAIEALKNKANINVFMLSPYGKMSAFQTAQMYSVNADNIVNIAVDGVFDDCQDLVKALNNDLTFKNNYHLGAVNSINFARILAQIVYYFKGYFMAVKEIGEPIDFVIPSGNFGNIFAGFYAKQMGLPIRNLVLATNENNVLDEFFKTGVYRPRKGSEVYHTSSPSMDIAKASNFERFIYMILGAEKTKLLWAEIDEKGFFDLSKDPIWQKRDSFGIVSGESNHQKRITTIQNVFEENQIIVDPHTADGIYVAKAHKTSDVPQLFLETAKPIKFLESIKEAKIDISKLDLKVIEDLEQLPQSYEHIDVDADKLKAIVQNRA